MRMRLTFIYRWLFLLGFLLGNAYPVFAQNTQLVRAQRIYEWFVAGQGDSIHVALNKDLQEKLAPAVFNDTFRQTEGAFGKLKSKGDWKTDNVGEVTIYYRDLEFERYNLRFMLAFDADGGMNTIRLAPIPAASAAKSESYDDTKLVEKAITVGADGFKLPGTLSIPKLAVTSGARKMPCVILVHGSGPNDRDETVGPNKPFRDLAWGLAERGIAVVRYDKRTKVYGVNSVPAGRVLDYDTEAVEDALATVSQVSTFPEIAMDSIYVLGHSLGGTLAPRIAEKSKGLAGIIILAGLARPLEDTIEEQFAYISSLTDSAANAKAQLTELRRQVTNVKKLGTDTFNKQIPLPLNLPRSYWEFANHYKPVEIAAHLKLPIFVLQGERDYQVTMEDFSLWRSGLLSCKNACFKSYPKLNHLLQEGSGKSTPFEYTQASPVPSYVIDDIAFFVRGGRDFL